ncbi:outer membrane lipoprotein carrier protein LolA [soil metagenome]
MTSILVSSTEYQACLSGRQVSSTKHQELSTLCKWVLLVLVMLASSSQAILAQDADMKAVKDTAAFKSHLKDASATTNTIDCDFTQKKHLSFMAEDITTTGHFSFKKERKIRWEYKKPYSYIVVINNNDIYLKDDDKTSHFDAKSNKMFQGINDMMVAIVKGNLFGTGDYKSTFFENDKYFFAKLIPIKGQMKEYMKSIDIYFDKKDMTVVKLKLTELSDDYTYIEYHNKVINKPLDDALFTIK